MTYYLHHVPGRLRVKAPFLQGQKSRTKQMTERLEALPGIIAVRANTAAGSITVEYDVRHQSREALLEAFRLGGVTLSVASRPSERERSRRLLIAREIGDALMSRALAMLIERCAIALVAALL